MTLLGRFALVLLVLGLGLGWMARRRWGPLRGARPWAIVLAVAPLHAVAVLARGVAVGAPSAALLGFAAMTVVLLGMAVVAATWAMRRSPRWSALVPPGHALLQGVATGSLGAPFAAQGTAPPGLGSALVVAIALVAAGAWLVWAPGRPSAAATGRPERSGRLRS